MIPEIEANIGLAERLVSRVGVPVALLVFFVIGGYFTVISPLVAMSIEQDRKSMEVQDILVVNIGKQTDLLAKMSQTVEVTRKVVTEDHSENKKELIDDVKDLMIDHEQSACKRETETQRLIRIVDEKVQALR